MIVVPPQNNDPGAFARAAATAPDLNATQVGTASLVLASAIAQERALSPYQKTQLMTQLLQSPVLTQMVKLGLLRWQDLTKPNDGTYKDPDGSAPDLMLDMAAIAKIKADLDAMVAQQNAQSIRDVIVRRRQRTVPGPKASRGGPFPGKKVYMGPRYLPGRLPNPQNVVLV